MNLPAVAFAGYAQRGVQLGDIGNSDLADRIPGLAKALWLAGSEEREVGLIVGINTGHQLDIWPIVIRKAAIPGIAELVITPCPLLFSRRDVVIGDMHDTRACRVIVTPEKILARV